MAEETENHTLRLLQEMRDENRQLRNEVKEGFEDVRSRLDEVETAISGLAYLYANNIGQTQGLEARVKRIEDKLGLAPAG